MVIEYAPLEDELGDVLEKGMRQACLTEHALAERAAVPVEKISDAIDYRYDLNEAELRRLASVLCLNEIGVLALAGGRYPLPAIAGLPFCLYPLRMSHGIGVANAYIVADCSERAGILFDTGGDYTALRRLWPKNITRLHAIFITHAETEHVGGLGGVQKEFGPVPVFGPKAPGLAGAALAEGGRVSFGEFEVRALNTPGHAEAHNCYVVSLPRVPSSVQLLVSGDLLFAGSVGGAYYCSDRLAKNLNRLVTELPESTVIAPGHGPLTTLKNERSFNPFIV